MLTQLSYYVEQTVLSYTEKELKILYMQHELGSMKKMN